MKTTLKKFVVLSRSEISRVLHEFDRVLHRGTYTVIVLAYHSISSDGWFHSVEFSELKKQVLLLKKLGFAFITVEDLAEIIAGKKTPAKQSVLITFDDGYKNIFQTKAFFRKHGVKPVVFLLGDTQNARRDELENNEPFLSKRDVLSLLSSGWSVGSHSGTHAQLDSLKTKELYKEVVRSKQVLEKMYKKKMHYFAYPKGRYNNRTLSLTKNSGYKLAFTMDDGAISKKTDSLRIPRIGINRSHTFSEFQTLWSPSVMQTRKVAKSILKNFV